MFIYNVTTHVAHTIHEAWVAWMQEKHIPDIMGKGCFTKYQFVRILETDEKEGVTYAVQFYANSKALYNRYIELYAPALRQDASKSWGDKTIGFRSLMEIVA
ncbi:DUF4286 family protein [Parasediminibacterium sp. JCM 36343]|uniref:DUF4286 family protein n=1 Tax=Parasediminibacterium sp. JCM 36343 TaxID=3374279 RepID=UPI00397936B0